MLKKYHRPMRFIIYLFLISIGVLGLPFTTAPQMAPTPLAALENPMSGPALALVVDVPTTPTVMGDETTLIISVTNNALTPLTDVRLQLPYHSDIIYQNSPYIAATEIPHDTLYLGNLDAEAAITLSLPVQVRGVSAGDAINLSFKALAVESDSMITEVTLPVQSADTETSALSTTDSQISVPDNPVTFHLSPAHEGQHLAFALVEKRRLLPQEVGSLYAFHLESSSETLAQTLTQEPIQATLSLAEFTAVSQLTETTLWLQTRPTAESEWEQVALTVDTAAETAQFAVREMGEFRLLQTTADPQPWELSYSPPGASAFTGSAQYSYPIATPPGIGGLAPDLTLNYNSRSIDSKSIPVMGSGLGLGWSMSNIEIVNGNTIRLYKPPPDPHGNSQNPMCCHNFDAHRFTLVLNGQTYRLQPKAGTVRHGQYTAIGGADMYIEYVANADAPNKTGEYWLIRTADGTTYQLGYTSNTEQVVAPASVEHNSDFGNENGQPMNITQISAMKMVNLRTQSFLQPVGK